MVANEDLLPSTAVVDPALDTIVEFDDGYIREFFPATGAKFVAKCGEVTPVKASDFQDANRRRHLESFQKSWQEWVSFEDEDQGDEVADEKARTFVSGLIDAAPTTQKEFDEAQRVLRRELRISISKRQMLAAFESMGNDMRSSSIDQFLVKKVVRTHSGVVVITVLTSPGSFSCPKDCHYCPNEPGQPRSYLSTEPAVLRANQNGWDSALQFWDRAATLYYNGHTIDKIEVLVLGGTWSGYPRSYQEEFVRDLFYAANCFDDYLRVWGGKSRYHPTRSNRELAAPEGLRGRQSLEEEQLINETAACRIIGLTLETRPDYVTKGELRRFRRFGCTRVQIGIQHTNEEILKKINRGCTTQDAIRAIRLLKDGCFKVDIHLMPDLPGSSPTIDKEMFELVLSSKELQADQWKIYPCEVTPYSQIEQWYKEGKFIPYAERSNGQELSQLLVKVKCSVHPWIRLNRVVRDIPNPSIIAGNSKTNLRQVVQSCMSKRNLMCRCLRCREVKTENIDFKVGQMKIRRYETLGGIEFFISFETEDETKLFGFLRLRIRQTETQNNFKNQKEEIEKPSTDSEDPKLNLDKVFPELIGCGLIRELHVYGQLVGCLEPKNQGDIRPQHVGFGKRLIAAAEVITRASGLAKMAVIAGIGTRDYYRKFGYEVEGYYMTKNISEDSVTAWVDQLNISLPLNIQVYDPRADLGQLNSSTGSTTNEIQTEVSVRDQTIQRGLYAKDKKTRYEIRKHRQSVKPDILTPFNDNCSPTVISHQNSQALAFIDHIEFLTPQYSFNRCFSYLLPLNKLPLPTLATTFIVVTGCLVTASVIWKRLRQ